MSETHPAPPTPKPLRIGRADQILLAAVAVVSLMVLAFAMMLAMSSRLHGNTAMVVQNSRDARAHIFEMLQAQNEANAAVYAYAGLRQPGYLASYRHAAADMRLHVAQLTRLMESDAELAQDAVEIQRLALAHLDLLDNWTGGSIGPSVSPVDAMTRGTALRTDLRDRITVLHNRLNQRIDVARAAEDHTRAQRDLVAFGLGALALISGILAIAALRRERAQWRLAQESAEAARQRAAESERAKSRFLAAASHDMRQPLHALTLYLAALRRRVEGEEAHGILTKMERAVQSMTAMFTGLLDLARIQAHVISADMSVFPLQDVLQRIAAHHPGARLAAFASAGAEMVRSDANLLERLLGNLVSNALKHGGGAALIDVVAVNGKAEIRIIDAGPGIAPEDQQRIFEEFVRIEGQRTEGLGLGLAIVKRLVDLIGAEIELKSKLGEGSTFIVRVPLAHDERADAPHEAPTSLAGVPTLVMDDDPLALEAIARALRDLGAHVRVARDENAVVSLLKGGFEPDLMVMDLRIDGVLAGLDIAKRACAALSHGPAVVMVTGETEMSVLEALSASGYGWLIKPVSGEDLLQATAAARKLKGERPPSATVN